METALADVASTSQDATESTVAESSPAVETAGESQGGVTATADAASTQQTETDPLEGIPSVEELNQLVAQKVPYSEALARLRPAYEGLKGQLAEYQTLDPWKPIAETIGDPQLAQSAHELVSAIHTPSTENPSGFTARPFLERLESDSPGTVDQLFADTLTFQIPDASGQPSTVVRELVRSWGLDPDRIDEYRNIDTLRASGVVTADELGKIDPKYHDAFKGLPRDAQEDILSLKETNPALADMHLRNAERARAAERFEQQQHEREQQQREADERQFKQQLTQAVEQDITAEVKSISDSIHQSLSSQWKPSGDDAQNSIEYAKVLSTLATLQHPAYRFIAENALKAVGASLEGFDELANRWQEQRSAYTTFTQMGDKMQAQRALSGATIAKQSMLVKLNDYARRLAQASGERLASAASQVETQLAAAQGRFVPNGNGQAQQGATNPYAQNPHPVGSQEYFAFNRKVDREYNLTNASVFGG